MLVVSVARRLGSGGETVVCASVRLTASPKGQLGTEAAMNSFHHRCASARPAGHRFALTRRDLLAATAAGLVAGAPAVVRAAGPQDPLLWVIYVFIALIGFVL